MARAKTRIYGSLPTASQKQSVRTQIFHGLPVPIQPARPARELDLADFAILDEPEGPRTRLMPIEELLNLPKPPPLAPALKRGATSATAGWQSRLRPSSMPRPRRLRLVVGLIALGLASYGSLPDVSASTPGVARALLEPTAEAPPALPEVAAKAEATGPAEETKPDARKGKRETRSASKGASPRRAGDLLAAGELPRAAKVYEQLAARAPADPVYAEAARILRQRVARPAQ